MYSRKMEPTQRSPFLMATIVILNIFLWMILLTAIWMGTIHLNDCPIQRNIPVFLIVMGVSGLVCLMLTYTRNTLHEGERGCLLCSIISTACYIFIFVWVIAGQKWIYSIYPPSYDPLSKDGYCQSRLYLFALGASCIGDIFISLVFICGVFMCMKTILQQTIGFSSYNRVYT